MHRLNGYLVPHPPLIVPGVGNGSEIPDTRKAYNKAANEIRKEAPDTIIIISPHSIMYDDYIHISPGESAKGDFSAFGASDIAMEAEYDSKLADEIGKIARSEHISAGVLGERTTSLDHGVMVPLHFIGTNYRIVRISLSGLSLLEHYRFGMCIRKAAEKLSRHIVIAASGDMSHKLKTQGPYGFAPEGLKFDALVCECIKNNAYKPLLTMEAELYEHAAECGLRSLIMMLGAMDGFHVKSELLCYEGPFGVGYLTASFTAEGREESNLSFLLEERNKKLSCRREHEDAFVRLARENIESYLLKGKMIELPPDLPREMIIRKAGVFVSIKKDGRLRGCIGTISPTQINIAQEILHNSISAAMEDPRFEPVVATELDSLVYSVDVLAPAEPIDSPDLLDVERYGVIVANGLKRGLLLPNLDGIDCVDEQISIAKQKAGIGHNEPYSLERFEVVRHK
ncbi:MAG: AmmeMemoRadiSam system protein A [Lachnoclostridium sp.]|jgi:AmmeMemoRadiSam system protein A/AmmeMemoRadiSam system protein B|nr:AmmeMemoRadiSam system protein A [Lachnoclostridium sp.]